MTKIKMCGIRRMEDVEFVNSLLPDYIGYVLDPTRKRYVPPEKAAVFTAALDKRITPVGVFVDEQPDIIIGLVKKGIIAAAQLHGSEDNDCVEYLKQAGVYVIQAFKIKISDDVKKAESSLADMILLDSGCGSGETFDHSLLCGIKRPYFLAGGLTPENVGEAVSALRPFAVDASSSLETDGFKDFQKMKAFADAVKNT